MFGAYSELASAWHLKISNPPLRISGTTEKSLVAPHQLGNSQKNPKETYLRLEFRTKYVDIGKPLTSLRLLFLICKIGAITSICRVVKKVR